MTSKIVVNNIEADAGVSTVTFGSEISASKIVTSSGEFTVGTGASVYSPATNVLALGTNNAERVRVTSGGNMGLGVTPETWSSNVKGFQIGRQACVSGQTGANIVEISANAYHNSGWKYIETDTATKYYQYEGSHRFETAGSGTADASISFTERLRIGSNGGVSISNAGTFPTSTNETLNIQGQGHNGQGTTNTRSVVSVIGAITDNANAAGLWIGARTNENTAVIGTRTATGNLAIETYNSGWAERFRIDNVGRVTMPYQPGFFATSTSSSSNQPGSNSTDDLGPRFNNVAHSGGFNTGNHYNTTTGVFTAPVTGMYYTFFNMRWETADFVQNSHIRIYISRNNSTNWHIHQINGANEAWSNYMAMSCSGVISLAAGDTLRPKGGLNGGTAVGYWGESSWGAWLLG